MAPHLLAFKGASNSLLLTLGFLLAGSATMAVAGAGAGAEALSVT